MSWRCQQTQVTWYHAIDTVWSIQSLFKAWRYVEWYSSVNTMPVYDLVKSMLTQFGWYHAGLGLGKVNTDTAWLIWCLFMGWWSQPTQFGQYQACLCSEDVYWQSLVNTLPDYVLTMSMTKEFGQYHACLCSDNVYWHSLVNTMPVFVLTISTARVWSKTCLVMFWRCHDVKMSWSWSQVGNIGVIIVHWPNKGHITHLLTLKHFVPILGK